MGCWAELKAKSIQPRQVHSGSNFQKNIHQTCFSTLTATLYTLTIFLRFSGATVEYRPCTAGGHHNVTSLNLNTIDDPCSKEGFREVIIRCNGDEVIEFIRASIQSSSKVLNLSESSQIVSLESRQLLVKPMLTRVFTSF